jgi:hypothetical protein
MFLQNIRHETDVVAVKVSNIGANERNGGEDARNGGKYSEDERVG